MAHSTTHDAHGEHHGLAHIMPVKVLVAVWAALMFLTVITVTATSIDLGSKTNLFIAMIIATVKAALVCLYFMHLKYDKRFNLLIFMGSLLFVFVFVIAALVDTGEYQADIKANQEASATP